MVAKSRDTAIEQSMFVSNSETVKFLHNKLV